VILHRATTKQIAAEDNLQLEHVSLKVYDTIRYDRRD